MGDNEFEKYIQNMCIFQGKMNLLANSIDLLLGVILEKSGMKTPKMLGSKIKEFKNLQSDLENCYNSDFVELTNKLDRSHIPQVGL